MPTEKTWYTSVDYVLPSMATLANQGKSILWALKALLMGQIAGPSLGPAGAQPAGAYWSCVGSSNGTTGVMDGTDRWGSTFSAGNINRAASSGARSWIVLKSPDAMGPYFLTIDYLAASAVDYQCVLALSKTLPTGGSASARPTAIDEIVFDKLTFMEAVTAWSAGKAHYACDADGNFWFFASKNGSTSISTVFAVQTLKNLRNTSDPKPVVLIMEGQNSGTSVLDEFSSGFFRGVNARVMRSWTVDGVVGVEAACLSFDIGSNLSLVQRQQGSFYFDNSIEALPLIACTFQASPIYYGLKGTFYDCKVVTNALDDAARYPSAGNVEAVLVGSVLVPLSAVPTIV